ncbi:MAG: hypothetical protein AB7F22_30060 [Reyranella sp.]
MLGQSAGRRLAILDELAEDEQAPVVGQDAQQAGDGQARLSSTRGSMR